MNNTPADRSSEPLLQVQDLQVTFKTDLADVRAVRGVSFDVYPGETVGIVGESGSGKSVTNLALMGLVPKPPGRIDGGQVWYDGQNLLELDERSMQSIRGHKIAMIFQDPMTALNPLMTVGQQLTEMTRLHLGLSKSAANDQAADMLELVGISNAKKRLRDYPHQFSGGMRQRVMIAMALSCQPDLLIADEPTTALDVTIQAQILELLRELQEKRGTSIIMITHDLGVVAEICDRVLVMYAGQVVEKAEVKELFANPQHPYTKGLLRSLPRFDQVTDSLYAIPGQPPDLGNLPAGCAFRDRCDVSVEQCSQEAPELYSLHDGRLVSCFVAKEEASNA